VKDKLAEEILAHVMGWDSAQVAEVGVELQMLAEHKYDSYEGYRPGVKFLENLGAWLHQFESDEDRQTALRFVREQLVFISSAELDHLIETVYPDSIRPMLIRMTASRLGCSPYAVKQIVEDPLFGALQRKLLILGLSDGARIDRLRRSAPPLSHEQIFLASDIPPETSESAVTKLREALKDDAAQFEHVLLVDDFYGSGYTLIRPDEDGGEAFKGRLWKAHERLETMKTAGVAAESATASILVYVASADARHHVESHLKAAGLDWELDVVLELRADLKVSDGTLAKICEWHYDDALIDSSKPDRCPMGYRGGALPLVLPHNTPNNSIGVLWADTTDREGSLQRRGLFPRYERHREDRR
jgi:hypothetical protein